MAQQQQRRRSLPVVAMEHVDRALLGAHRLQRGAAEQREAEAIIGIVAPVDDVVVGSVEARRVIDQAQSIATCRRAPRRHWDRPAATAGHAQFEAIGPKRHGQPAIERQVDVDFMAELAERPGQGVDNVGQAARLGERLTFRGDHGDAHRPMLDPSADGQRASTPGQTGPAGRTGAISPNRFTSWHRSCSIPNRAAQDRYSHPAAGRVAPPRQARRAGAACLQPATGCGIRGCACSSGASTSAPGCAHRNPVPLRPAAPRLVGDPRRRRPDGRVPHPARRLRSLHGERRRPLVRAPARQAARRPDCLLLRRVRPERVAGHLLGRPRRARRRPPQGRLGHGHPVHRRRPVLSPRLLSPDDRCRRPPGTRLSRLRPAAPAAAAGGRRRRWHPLRIGVEVPGRTVWCAVWLAQVGRVPLLLLDTDIPDNDDADRPITHILYVRGREMRLHQEIVLGVGGVRALRALGIEPRVWHLNEGHSRVHARRACARADRSTAWPSTRRSSDVQRNAVFTIHTPVSAGNERFDARPRAPAGRAARSRAAVLILSASSSCGRGTDNDADQFDMTAFSLRQTNGANAVSHPARPDGQLDLDDVLRTPILGITNGVHPPSWVGEPVAPLCTSRWAPTSTTSTHRPSRSGRACARCADEHLWDAHRRQKLELAYFCRRRLQSQFARHGEAPSAARRAVRGARSGHPHDWLRAPLRDLQARRADLLRRGAAGHASCSTRAAGADRLCRQGAPGRPARPAA